MESYVYEMMKVGLVVVFLEIERRSFPCQNSQSIQLTECRLSFSSGSGGYCISCSSLHMMDNG